MSKRNWALDVGPGWRPIIQPVIDAILASGGTIHQVKEKFGGLRLYAHCNEEMARKIVEAERQCAKTCEVCGKPGELFLDGGWWRTTCKKHQGVKYWNK